MAMSSEGPLAEGLPVAGYRPQTEEAVARVNEFKRAEERMLRWIDKMDAEGPPTFDRRWGAIARNHLQQGFMALARAVFQPERIALPEDEAQP